MKPYFEIYLKKFECLKIYFILALEPLDSSLRSAVAREQSSRLDTSFSNLYRYSYDKRDSFKGEHIVISRLAFARKCEKTVILLNVIETHETQPTPQNVDILVYMFYRFQCNLLVRTAPYNGQKSRKS